MPLARVERFEVDGLGVEVLDVERRRIHKVRIVRHAVAEAAASAVRTGGLECARPSRGSHELPDSFR